MNDFDLDPGIPTFVDSQSKAETAVIALIAEEEFAWAQVVIPDLADHFGYEDWLDCREGSQLGLSMAGVDVKMVPVVLSPFLAWCRLTETSPSERALDAFASIILILRNPPEPSVIAVVRQREFEEHSREVVAFARHVDYQRWIRHRELMRARVAASGARIEELPIRVGDFVEWGKCLGENMSESMLDRYAQLVLEHLTSDLER